MRAPGEKLSGAGVPGDRVSDGRCQGETPQRPRQGGSFSFCDATEADEWLTLIV
jgi:hypothetical protein